MDCYIGCVYVVIEVVVIEVLNDVGMRGRLLIFKSVICYFFTRKKELLKLFLMSIIGLSLVCGVMYFSSSSYHLNKKKKKKILLLAGKSKWEKESSLKIFVAILEFLLGCLLAQMFCSPFGEKSFSI